MAPTLETLQRQLTQLLVEQRALEQALVVGSLAFLAVTLLLASLVIFLARRCIYSSDALLAAECRHWQTQQRMAEQHSNDRAYSMTQMLHGFEGIVRVARKN